MNEHNVDVILQDQEVRQRHHPGEQNPNEECYSEDATDDFDEGQYNVFFVVSTRYVRVS